MELGRLETVPLRDVWKHEASGFSRWLSDETNLKLLSDTIGLELAIEAVEQSVGPFRADVLCKVTGNSDHWVLIENQIERTDHTHLGQLLTYAAGLHTATIVWIAQRFTDEHRAALDWLNEITNEEISFFGLEIELWRIGNSAAAPKFNIVSKPNVFVKASHAERTGLTERNQLYLGYWTAFKALIESKGAPLRPLKPATGHWYDLGTIGNGIRLRAMAGARDKYNMVDLVIYEDQDKSKLEALRSRAGESLPREFVWNRKDGYKESTVELVLRGPDPADKSDWPSQHAWLLEKLMVLHSTLGPLVKDL